MFVPVCTVQIPTATVLKYVFSLGKSRSVEESFAHQRYCTAYQRVYCTAHQR